MNGQKNITTASDGNRLRLDTLELAPLLARRELWLLISIAYVDPFHRRFAMLKDPPFREKTMAAASLLRQERKESELGPGEMASQKLSPETLFDALDNPSEEIETTYRQLFGLTIISQLCPPCEIEYEPNTELVYRCQRFADVAGFYRAFGVQSSARAGERLDHITAETEFLYLLLAKQVTALQAGNSEGCKVSRDAHREFFREHVGWWIPAFSRLLWHTAPPGFYRELATLTAGLSALERVSLKLPPFKTPAVPKPSEIEEACAECPGS